MGVEHAIDEEHVLPVVAYHLRGRRSADASGEASVPCPAEPSLELLEITLVQLAEAIGQARHNRAQKLRRHGHELGPIAL